MATVNKGTGPGPGLASAGGGTPKKPTGRLRLPLPADYPDISPKRNKKGQAPQFIRSYRDLPAWKDRREKARFIETPPEHLNKKHTDYYHTQHNLLMTANGRFLRKEIEWRPARDIESRARHELWVLWFMALIEARRVGEAGDEEGADDVQGETDPEATEDDEHAEGETDPEATEEDEDAEGDTDPKSSRRTRSKRTRGKSRRRDEACIVSLHFLQFFSGPWLYDRAR